MSLTCKNTERHGRTKGFLDMTKCTGHRHSLITLTYRKLLSKKRSVFYDNFSSDYGSLQITFDSVYDSLIFPLESFDDNWSSFD